MEDNIDIWGHNGVSQPGIADVSSCRTYCRGITWANYFAFNKNNGNCICKDSNSGPGPEPEPGYWTGNAGLYQNFDVIYGEVNCNRQEITTGEVANYDAN